MPWSDWRGTRSKPICTRCGWKGEKRDLECKRVDLEPGDSVFCGLQCLFGSPPSHRLDYSCPSCHRKLASDLKFYQPFYDQETFAD